ncbi:hypothetical protein DMENIID0001_076260 [Sergentomyia squamirostris]
MTWKDFQCALCFIVLVSDQCAWVEGSKIPESSLSMESERNSQDFEAAAVAESAPSPHYHRIQPPHPPPSSHVMPYPPHPGNFYSPPPSYYPQRHGEEETLQEMKETVSAFSSMQKEFLNSLKNFQDSGSPPPIVEMGTSDSHSDDFEDDQERDPKRKYPRTTQNSPVKDVLAKVTRKRKPRPVASTTVIQVPQAAPPVPVQPIQPVQSIPTMAVPVQTVQTANTFLPGGLSLRLRNALDKTLSITHAEKTFATLKSDLISAIWTGVIVAAVKMAPLILLGIKLVFKALLPLVGMSLLNRVAPDVPAVQLMPVVAANAPATLANPLSMPTTIQQDFEIDHEALLDEEFENMRKNFYR